MTNRPIAVGAMTCLANGVLLTLCGMGAQRARLAGEKLLEKGVSALLSWGSAAALDERLTPGSLALPEIVIGADGALFQVDLDWQRRLYQRLASEIAVYTGPLAESHSVLATPADKRALLACSGAMAVDMESAALGRLAQRAQVPFIVVRAIADSAAMTVPRLVLNALDGEGRLHPFGLLAGLILNPRQWPDLVRLARGFHAAQATLAHVVKCSDDGLLFHPEFRSPI